MDWSTPHSLIGWAEFLANVATVMGVAGGLAIGLALHLDLRASIEIRRRDAVARRLSELSKTVEATGATGDILNAVLHWARDGAYPDGLSSSEFDALTAKERHEYRRWAAHLVALFDLVLLDPLWERSEGTVETIRLTLSKHGTALRRLWPYRRHRVRATSAEMGRIIEAALA